MSYYDVTDYDDPDRGMDPVPDDEFEEDTRDPADPCAWCGGEGETRGCAACGEFARYGHDEMGEPGELVGGPEFGGEGG